MGSMCSWERGAWLEADIAANVRPKRVEVKA